MPNPDFMGQDGFVWFVGVVEDRNDPERIGRVRVRCLGYHTKDLTRIATEDLPWAVVMSPTDTPSMNGLGHTPPFLVEGSWVVGFFRDPHDLQQPIILGSLPGINTEIPENSSLKHSTTGGPLQNRALTGYHDPMGVYPRTLGDTDVNLLARGSIAKMHPARILREQLRLKKFSIPGKGDLGTSIPTATKPKLSRVSDTLKSDDPRVNWEEPEPANASVPTYPFNHVHESEIGHVHEIDDNPNEPRLLKQHISGTFEEIQGDGTKITKIVSDNYEIILGSSNVFIKGAVNLTVEGNVKQLIKGDYVLEVEGDYTQKIHKNKQIKVGAGDSGGNLEEEVIGSHGYLINQEFVGSVGMAEEGKKNYTLSIGGAKTESVVSYIDWSTDDEFTLFAQANMSIIAISDASIRSVSGIMAMSAGTNINIRSGEEMKLKSGSLFKLQTVGAANVTHDSTYDVHYKGIATHQWGSDRKERTEEDHWITKIGGFVDRTCPVDPVRTGDVDCISEITPALP